MLRQLPTVDIDGTVFCIDVQKEELRQADNGANRISFNLFRQLGNGYTFLYDIIRKNAPRNRQEATAHLTDMRWVTLPALMELDPEGLALKYNIPLEVLCPDKEHPIPKNVTAAIRMVVHTDKQH